MTRVIYAIRSIAHFSYHESTVNALLAAKVDLLLVFDEFWSNYGTPSTVAFDRWRAEHPKVSCEYFPGRKGIFRKPIMFLREVRSYSSYCTRGNDATFYRNRWLNYLKFPPSINLYVNSRTGRALIGLPIVRSLLSLVEWLVPADRRIMGWLHQKQPDVVVASPCNMRYDQEIELVKAAKKLGIPTAIPVLSWDNPSTKGLFHIHPDKILAWHDGHRDECIRYHGIHPKKISIVGAPFFDKWFNHNTAAMPRDIFCQHLGIDPSRPYVLYLGSSANIAVDETWLVRELHAALRKSDDPYLKQIQIVFRAHPANWKHGASLMNEGISVWPREGTLPDSEATFEDFFNTLTHAACVIGLNTSGMVDAIILNKPVISPLIDRYRLTQEKAEHFHRMRSHNTLYIANNTSEILRCIASLRTSDPLREHRQAFVTRFIRPQGIQASAGAITAKSICALAPQLKPIALTQPWNGPAPKKTKSVITQKTTKVGQTNTDVEAMFSHFTQMVEKERNSELYRFYLQTRDKILAMVNSYKMSRYWYEEVMGFDYLFDASPLLVSKIREHCYHITGERSYTYRSHHAHKAPPFISRLEDLRAIDRSDLFVPESDACGGFGYATQSGRINLDTLKFYEVLIGLDHAGCLDIFKQNYTQRKAVVEIGSGWGGFAYQFHTHFPNTTLFCIDLPATLIFSTTYLRGACPNAKIALLGDLPNNELFRRWQEFDFIFIPANALAEFRPTQLDLAVNMCSFQEMTTQQVREYIDHIANAGCKRVYSLNRDRSHHNPELSLVSEIMSTRYTLQPVTLLPTEYCTVGSKAKAKPSADMTNNPSAYRHFAGSLK